MPMLTFCLSYEQFVLSPIPMLHEWDMFTHFYLDDVPTYLSTFTDVFGSFWANFTLVPSGND